MAMDMMEYFRRRCSEMLVMERDIWQLNQHMAQECHNPKLKAMFERHSEPTRHQISNLEQVVDNLGGILGPEESPVTRGMIRAHQMFMENDPPPNIIDIHNAIEGDKVEHMEIASYMGLITLARQLGLDDIVPLLQQNLISEEEMRSREESSMPSLIAELTREQRKAA